MLMITRSSLLLSAAAVAHVVGPLPVVENAAEMSGLPWMMAPALAIAPAASKPSY
jgi:hypothetical protein